MELDAWVSEHNPPERASYGKGWWDYVEHIRALSEKFGANATEVVGTYQVETPPPTAQLTMPVTRLKVAACTFVIAWQLGAPHRPWIVSVVRPDKSYACTLGLFDPDEAHSEGALTVLPPEFRFGPYISNASRFTCRLEDMWDVATLGRSVVHSANPHHL